MDEEYFDVLDENGNKTGETESRNEVHRDGDWHRTIHVWIFNQDGEILLQRRCATKDSNPNKLDISCAGHLMAGDDSITAAIRELKEELGLDAKPEDLHFVRTIKRSSRPVPTFLNNEFADVYVMRTDKKIEELTFQKEEISEIFYVPYDEFRKMVNEGREDLLKRDEEFKVLFSFLDT